jgi:hypothetical protein
MGAEALARNHPDDQPLAIDVAEFKVSEFAASQKLPNKHVLIRSKRPDVLRDILNRTGGRLPGPPRYLARLFAEQIAMTLI